MWLRESQPVRPQNTTPRFKSRPQVTLPVVENANIKCFKCGKLDHLSVQCFTESQNFQRVQHPKRQPEPIRNMQEEEETTDYSEMIQEEHTNR